MQAEIIGFSPRTSSQAPPQQRAAVAAPSLRRSQRDPAWVRWGLTAVALSTVAVLIGVPVV